MYLCIRFITIQNIKLIYKNEINVLITYSILEDNGSYYGYAKQFYKFGSY